MVCFCVYIENVGKNNCVLLFSDILCSVFSKPPHAHLMKIPSMRVTCHSGHAHQRSRLGKMVHSASVPQPSWVNYVSEAERLRVGYALYTVFMFAFVLVFLTVCLTEFLLCGLLLMSLIKITIRTGREKILFSCRTPVCFFWFCLLMPQAYNSLKSTMHIPLI